MAHYKMTTGLDDHRVRNFVTHVGPKVLDYLRVGDEEPPRYKPAVVISIPTGGTHFGTELRTWLLREGVDAQYEEFHKEGGPPLAKAKVKGRTAILVDDSVQTGKTYREIMDRMNAQQKRLGIVEIKYAVDHDPNHMADFSSENGNGGFLSRLLGTKTGLLF